MVSFFWSTRYEQLVVPGALFLVILGMLVRQKGIMVEMVGGHRLFLEMSKARADEVLDRLQSALAGEEAGSRADGVSGSSGLMDAAAVCLVCLWHVGETNPGTEDYDEERMNIYMTLKALAGIVFVFCSFMECCRKGVQDDGRCHRAGP